MKMFPADIWEYPIPKIGNFSFRFLGKTLDEIQAEYAKKVGQLTMQVDWLKKKSEEICGPDYESKFSPKPFDD